MGPYCFAQMVQGEAPVKTVLYISYDGMTDPLGQSQVLPYLVALSEKGYKFTILSFEKKIRYDKEKERIHAIIKEAGISWVPLTFSQNPPVVSKIYDRWRMKRKSIRLFTEHRFDLIHCRSYIAAEMGLLLKRRFGTRFLFDMRGFWADEKVDSGQWNQRNFFFRGVYKYYKKKEKDFLLNADAVVSLTIAAKDDLLSKVQYDQLQIDVIPCCADMDHFDFYKISINEISFIREKIGIKPDQKVITYLGSVGGWYLVREMFIFFKQLLLKHPNFVLLLLTKDDAGTVRRQAAEVGIPAEKLFITFAGRDQLPGYLALSACSIFLIRPTYSKIASSPTKHAELMSMGIPVICNNIGDTGNIIQHTTTGLLINEFSPKEYDRIIGQLDELLSIPKDRIRQSAAQYFDLGKGVEKYNAIYQRILS